MSFSFYINDIDIPLYIEMILLLSFIRQEDIIWQYYILEITERHTHYVQLYWKDKFSSLRGLFPLDLVIQTDIQYIPTDLDMTITLSLYFFLLHKGFPVSSSLLNDDHTASTLDSS